MKINPDEQKSTVIGCNIDNATDALKLPRCAFPRERQAMRCYVTLKVGITGCAVCAGERLFNYRA